MSYFRPRKRFLQSLLTNSNPVYIEVDASSLIQSDCNLKCSSFRKSVSDKIRSDQDALAILSEIGINTIRLHSFHTPPSEYSYGNLSSINAMAQRISSLDFYFHLTIHYSDIPLVTDLVTNQEDTESNSRSYHQSLPDSWSDIIEKPDLSTFKQRVHDHTVDILSKLEYLTIAPHLISIVLMDPQHPVLRQLSHCDESANDVDNTECSVMKNYAFILNGSISAIEEIFDDEDIPIMFDWNHFMIGDIGEESLKNPDDAVIAMEQWHQILEELSGFGVHPNIIGIPNAILHGTDSTHLCAHIDEQDKPKWVHQIKPEWMQQIKERVGEFNDFEGNEIGHSIMISDNSGNVDCFAEIKDIVENKDVGSLIGIQYPLTSMFDSDNVLKKELYRLTVDKERQLNWTYVFLTVLFVAAIAYNFCFWNKQRTLQQRQLLGILKSST